MTDSSNEFDQVELTITDIANGGQGIGRHDGKAIFVPYTIPGEDVAARITNDRGRYAFAEGVTLLNPSADRVLPRCPHFGLHKCGGCTWQHMDYPAQLALKTDIVLDQLARIGGFEDAPVEMAIPSPQEWAYRHEAVLYPMPDGKLGFRSTDPDRIMGVDECHIITPDLLATIPQIDLDLDTLTQVILRDNGQEDVMVILSTNDDEAPSLEIDLNASVNFLLQDNEPANLIGETHLRYQFLGKSYRVTAGSFLRPNIAQTELLMSLIRDWVDADDEDCVLDLYGGVGLFASVIAPDANLVHLCRSLSPRYD